MGSNSAEIEFCLSLDTIDDGLRNNSYILTQLCRKLMPHDVLGGIVGFFNVMTSSGRRKMN